MLAIKKYLLCFLLVFCSTYTSAQVPTPGTSTQLYNQTNTTIIDNTSGMITPFGARSLFLNIIATIFAPNAAQTSPTQYGALCDGVTDDTVALQTWASSLLAGQVGVLPGTCVFSSPIVFASVDNITLTGGGLLYKGAITTGNLITIGTSVSGCSIQGWKISRMMFQSTVTMTSGDGIRINDMCSSTISNIAVGGFNKGAGDNHFYNGIHFNGGNSIHLNGYVFSAGSEAEIINGDASIQFTDMFQIQGLIFQSGIGLNIAGNMGGFSIDQTDILENGTNVRISQDVIASGNLQLFFGPQFFSDSTNGTGPGIGVDFSDPGSGEAIATFSGSWLATATNQCMLIEPTAVNWKISMFGGQVLNCHAAAMIDNESTNTGVRLTLAGTQFSQCCSGGTYAVRNAGAASELLLQGSQLITSQQISGAYVGTWTDGGTLYSSAGGNNITQAAIGWTALIGPGTTSSNCGMGIFSTFVVPYKMDGSSAGCAMNLGNGAFPWTSVWTNELQDSPGYLIANLPSCSAAGGRTSVTNGIASPAYHQAVSATGGNTQPVYCNGGTWIYD